MAAYWHHHTTKGGSKEKDDSKILAIARWISRMMMWHTGEGDRYFKKLSKSNNKI